MLLTSLMLGSWALPGASWTLMVLGLVWIAASDPRPDWSPVSRTLAAFAGVAAVGLYGLALHPPYDVIKDLWYFSKPIVEIAFGYAIARRRGNRAALMVFMVASALVSAQYVLTVGWRFAEYRQNDLLENRLTFGPGSFLSLIPVLLLGDRSCRDILLGAQAARPSRFLAIGLLGLLAVGLSGSRTLLVLLIGFGLLSLLVEYPHARRWLVRGGVAALVLVLIGEAVGIRGGNGDGSPGFVERAVEEMMVSDYASEEEINLNWRGYESFMALQQLKALQWRGVLVGGGLGQLVDLDIPWVLGGVEFEAIPHLHNGYFYLLVKTGALGLLLFFVALTRLGRALRPSDPDGCGGPGRPLRWWVVIALVLATSVVTGPYNKMDLMSLMTLCGVWIAIASRASVFGLPEEPAGQLLPTPQPS